MSLKSELKKRILDDVIKRSRSGDEYVVLVVDSHTSQILSSCCRVYDVMDAGVLVLENLGKVREKLDMSAVYFLEPSEASVRRLLLDFADKKAPQYTEVFLYFTSRVPDELMQDISACPQLVDRVKDLKEMNCDFVAYESRVFLFNRRSTIIDLYHPDSNGEVRHKELDTTAKQIVGVCITMGEYPHIRYNAANKICSDVAVRVEDGLNRLASAMPDWEMNRDRERGTLLILDRSVDPLAPLMHEYTYQAMICDLVKIKGEVAYIPKQASDEDAKELEESADSLYKEVLLAEDDPLWVEFRHQHIGQVLQTITKKFAEFKGKNAMAKMSSKGGEANVKDMINAMKAMPEYKAMIRQYFKHLSLAEECMKHFDDDYLEVLSELEQDMATGLDKNKREVKSKDVQNRITTMLQSDKVTLPNKLRALMIYVISQGSVGRSRKDLLDAAGINSTLERVIINLKYLGIDLQKKVQPVNRNQERLALAANAMNRISMNLMRFVPLLSEIASQLVQDTLSRETYPYLKEPPIKSRAQKEDVSSSRKKRTGWRVAREPAENKEDDKASASTSRYLIVMLGGVTYSEMRCVYEIVQDTKAQLYIGSTEALTGEHFIRALGGFEEDADINTVGRKLAAAAAGPSGAKPSAAGGSSAAAAKGGNKKAAAYSDEDDDYDSLDDDDDAPPRKGKSTPAPKGSSRR